MMSVCLIKSRWVPAVNISQTKFWLMFVVKLCFLLSCFVNMQIFQRVHVSAFEEFCIDEHDIFDGDEWAALLYQLFGTLKLSSTVFKGRKVLGMLWWKSCWTGLRRSLGNSRAAVCSTRGFVVGPKRGFSLLDAF
jgi:hypothetical protein